MNDASYLKTKHQAGLPFDQYIQTGSPQQQQDWNKVYEQATLTDTQSQLVQSFTRQINIVGMSGIWCGDCSQQCPLIQKIASINPESLNIRWLDRDEHADLQKHVTVNAGKRVPILIFCAEDYELVGWYGDRTLSRYRAMAKRQLGPSCPLPGAAVPDQEVAAMLQDWLNEIERVHLLLRLSTRLRSIHSD